MFEIYTTNVTTLYTVSIAVHKYLSLTSFIVPNLKKRKTLANK